MPFDGNFDHTLDAKNRLTVPSKFRAAFADGIVVARGIEKCASLWTPDDFTVYVDRALDQLNPMTEQARKLERYFGSGSFRTELDAAGRVMIPPKILAHAELGKDVVVIGTRRCLELWAPARWEAIDGALVDEVPGLAESLGQGA